MFFLETNLRIGQTGLGLDGYYEQSKDFNTGYVFIVSPPASWHPIIVDNEYSIVGAYCTATIVYVDSSTEFVELLNNVV